METSFSGSVVVEFSLLSELLFELLSSVGSVSISSGVVSVGGARDYQMMKGKHKNLTNRNQD